MAKNDELGDEVDGSFAQSIVVNLGTSKPSANRKDRLLYVLYSYEQVVHEHVCHDALNH